MPKYRIDIMSKLIPADPDTIHDAARIRGYRRVGNWLCLSGVFSEAFLREIRELQIMKDRAAGRRAQREKARP